MVKISMRQSSSLLGGKPKSVVPRPMTKSKIDPHNTATVVKTGEEFAVDEAIAVDRLREHAAQRAAGIFAADRIEAQGDADQRDRRNPRSWRGKKSIRHSK